MVLTIRIQKKEFFGSINESMGKNLSQNEVYSDPEMILRNSSDLIGEKKKPVRF